MISNNLQIYTSSLNNNCEIPIPSHTQNQNSNKFQIRYDILKILYAGMLLNFNPDQIRQFWKQHPLPVLDYSDEAKTFIELLQGHSWYSAEFVFSVFNDLELFLNKNDLNVLEFIENSFYKVNHGLLVSPKSWLAMSKPVFKSFFTESDIRVLLLSLLNHYLSFIAPAFSCKVVSHISEYDWNTSILSIKNNFSNSNCSLKAGPDDPNSYFDAELWFTLLIKKTPECFGLPRYEHHFMAADCREINSIVRNVTVKDDFLYINDQIGAERTSFKNFCACQGIDLAASENIDIPVWVMRTDYLCPIRKRIVLHQGCAYGAPVYLFGFHYLKLYQSPDNFLDSIIDDIVSFNDYNWSKIKALHNKLIIQLTGSNNFTYDRKNESMQLNGIEFIKNVPAKILRKILYIYSETGRTEFYHCEFTKDESIIDNPYQPNFSIRLKRLINAFENSNTSIELQKLNKGKFLFRPECRINFNEIN